MPRPILKTDCMPSTCYKESPKRQVGQQIMPPCIWIVEQLNHVSSPTPGLFHCTPLVLDDRGPNSLNPRDSGAAGKVGSQKSCPLLRHWLRRDAKSWFRYFTALVLEPNPAASALFLANVDATPAMVLLDTRFPVSARLDWGRERSHCWDGKFCIPTPPLRFAYFQAWFGIMFSLV